MYRQKCCFVPPYLFDRLAKHFGESGGDRLGTAIRDARQARMEQLPTRPVAGPSNPRTAIIPEYILQRIAKVENKAEEITEQTGAIVKYGEISGTKKHYRAVYDARNNDNMFALPRKEGSCRRRKGSWG